MQAPSMFPIVTVPISAECELWVMLSGCMNSGRSA